MKMLPRFFCSCVAVVLALTAARAESAFEQALNSDSESVFSPLDNGAMVENVVFRRVYEVKNPSENAIVVTVPEGNTTTAIVVYTQNGRLFARHPALGKVALTGFAPADLLTDEPKIEAAIRALYAKDAKPVNNSPSFTATQLTRAYELLHDRGGFPSALTQQPFTVNNPDGSSTVYPPGSVVFDWNGIHYFYRPELGVRGQPIPRDPVTGQPYLCVRFGDLVESVAFYHNYLKLHPDEKATILAPGKPRPPDPKHPVDLSQYTWAATAYTKKGQLYIHSNILGDVQLVHNTVADLAKPEVLHVVFMQLLREKLQAKWKAPALPALPQTIDHVAAELGTVAPSSLPGDDPDMQLRRVCLALKNLDGNLGVYWMDLTSADGRHTSSSLRIYCEDNTFIYTSVHHTFRFAFRDRANPSELVAGLLFTLDYQKKHPMERTLLLPSATANSTTPIVLYTKNGQTYYYQHIIGSFPLPTIKPEDWTDPAKQAEIRDTVKKLFAEEHQKEFDGRQHVPATELAREKEENKQFEVANVCEVFHDAGFPCKIVSERDLGEDGHITEYPVPTLVFAWNGATYTYNPLHLCVHTDGYFPFRFRIE